MSPASGILLVDKPGGITSHDVVARTRRAFGTRKIGHAGTLDPMATGLLVLGIEGSTRLLTYLVGLDKTYETTIRLGSATTTDDAEGETVSTAGSDELAAVTDARIAEGVARLTGRISQVPSTFSAIKVDGKRAYDLARAGQDVELKSREVTISRFAVGSIRRSGDAVELDATVDCSSGTYIRALARDLGADLGVGGHLTMLRRTRIGPFDLADAHELDSLSDGVPAPLDPAEVAARVLGRPHLPHCYPRRVATHFANSVSVGQLTERQYDEHRSRDGPDPSLQPADHRNRFVFARLVVTSQTQGFQFELNDPFQPIF